MSDELYDEHLDAPALNKKTIEYVKKERHEALLVELEKVKEELLSEQKRSDLHANLNREVAKSLGLEFGQSWHDLPKRVKKLMEENKSLKGLIKRLYKTSTYSEIDCTMCVHCGEDDYYHEIRHQPDCPMLDAKKYTSDIV